MIKYIKLPMGDISPVVKTEAIESVSVKLEDIQVIVGMLSGQKFVIQCRSASDVIETYTHIVSVALLEQSEEEFDKLCKESGLR